MNIADIGEEVASLRAANLKMRDYLLALAAECQRCGGTGSVSVQYGGDGYGSKCSALADGEKPCPRCREIREALR